MVFRTFSIAATLVLFAVVAQRAGAEGHRGDATRQIHVSYADLDLQQERGARALLERMEKASLEACGGWPAFTTRYTEVRAALRRCRAEAVRSAVATLNEPLVTGAYRERFGREPVRSVVNR